MSNFPYINLTSKQLAELAEEHRHNVDILGDLLHELAFRKRKKAFAVRQKVIDYLNQTTESRFLWPSTEAPESSISLDAIDAQEKGLLGIMGYRVGQNGLSEFQRRDLLSAIYEESLVQCGSPDYMAQWGNNSTSTRLQKLANCLATFTRNAKRRHLVSLTKSVQNWEDDLSFLKKSFYEGRYSFDWPETTIVIV